MVLVGAETVTRISRSSSEDDKYGNPIFTESKTSITGCLIEIGASDIARTIFSETARIELVVYAPAGTNITPDDLFEVYSKRYKLSTEVKEWKPALGSIITPRVIFGLERTNG